MQESNFLDIAQTRKWLHHVWSDFWWEHEMPITGGALSLACGYTTSVLKPSEVKRMGPTRFRVVSRIIPEIEARRLCFQPKKNIRNDRFLWIEPPPKRVIQKLSPKDQWNLSAHCVGCGKNQFLPVEISGDDKPYVACYHCLAPDQYRSFGGELVSNSLIHEALKNYH